MMLEGECYGIFFSRENRKPAAYHIFMSTLFHKTKVMQEYIVYLTFNQ